MCVENISNVRFAEYQRKLCVDGEFLAISCENLVDSCVVNLYMDSVEIVYNWPSIDVDWSLWSLTLYIKSDR